MEANYLQLIYIRKESDYDNHKHKTEAILNGKYNIKQKDNGKIIVKKEKHYIAGLWGKSIFDCYAIVGENGSGKTRLMNIIMELFRCLKDKNLAGSEQICILFENIQTEELEYYCLNSNLQFYLETDGEEKHICELSKDNIRKISENYKVAYVHNILSRQDYINDLSCDYDFSVGGLINRDFKMNVEMKYSSSRIDKIQNYFDKQQFQMIDFVYKFKQKNGKNLPLPLPKTIEISFTDDHYNWEYIVKELKKLKWKGFTEAQIENEARTFQTKIQNMYKDFAEYVSLWIAETIKKLIINCFKEIVIPQVVPSPDTCHDCEIFWELFEKNIISKQNNIYRNTLTFLNELQSELRDHLCIKKTIDFIEWLEKNQSRIQTFEYPYFVGNNLFVPVDDGTYEFMTKLIRQYGDMNFAFPFYTFTFDISTGEYDFLSFFSELYSIVDKEEMPGNVYAYSAIDNNVNNLLLLLDEADLSFHPRWQKNFICWMTEFINSNFTGVKVQIIVATHSPILLSDFPSTNVSYLSKGRGKSGSAEDYMALKNDSRKTFGCNIHTLFLNSFFLEDCGTLGMLAEKKINELADFLLNDSDSDLDEQYVKNMIECIGEGILQKRLQKLYSRKFPNIPVQIEKKKQDNAISETLKLLKKQREEIDRLINELERKND